jgi:hypothetical protein
MAYIGNQPSFGKFSKLDNIQAGFNSVTVSFTLQVGTVNTSPGTAQNVFISLNGVWQEPGVAYTVSSSTITFDVAPAFGTDFFGVQLGSVGVLNEPADLSVTSAKLSNTAIPVLKGGTGVTTITGIVKGNGVGAMSVAAAGTDYQAPIGTISGIVKGSGANTLAAAVAGTDYQAPIGTISGLVKGNGPNLLAAAVAGTDYQAPIGTLSGLVKGNGPNLLAAAVAGTDFLTPAGSDSIISGYMLRDIGYGYTNSGDVASLNYGDGLYQRWAPTGTKTLSITTWPPTGNLGQLLIEGINLGAATITWPTINWIKSDGTMTTTFSSSGVTLQSSGTDFVLLWTRDAGTTIYGKVVR